MVDISVVSHALFVHFSIALIVMSSIGYCVSMLANKYLIKHQARLLARWALWVAAAATLFAVVTGMYAYSSSGHDDHSHFLLNEHRNLAGVVTIIVICLALWAGVLFNDDKEEGMGFLLLNLSTAAGLFYIVWTGTILVYQYGVGVSNLPTPEQHSHHGFKRLSDSDDDDSLIEKLQQLIN